MAHFQLPRRGHGHRRHQAAAEQPLDHERFFGIVGVDQFQIVDVAQRVQAVTVLAADH